MGIKINVSLSVKLTFIVITVSAFSIIAVTYVNISSQDQFFWEQHYQRAASMIQALHSTIGEPENLQEYEMIENKTNKFINSTHPDIKADIKRISISLPDENEDLYIAYSTDESKINEIPDFYEFHKKAYESRKQDENDYYFIVEEGTHDLTMIYPINLSGHVYGTSELRLSMSQAYSAFDNQVRTLIFVSILSLFVVIFVFLYLLRKSIVKPIMEFRDTAKEIGKGNLDKRININTRDELGDLANAFNQMARDLKESRDKIQEYNKILENLINQKDEFIGQLGHDLKNPLQPLVGLLPMLIEQEKDSKIKEALQIMNKNVEYMRDLIFKTLQLAKLRSANIKFDIEDLNLKDETNEVIESQKIVLKENDIKIENKISSKIFVKADKLRLSELFKNLINNSVKYTKEKGKITLATEDKGKVVQISVTDNGIGMTKEQLNKVFDEFYKADKFSSEYDSSGLGLAICKRIVEKHNVKMWVDSKGKGKGTTFYFTLKKGNEK